MSRRLIKLAVAALLLLGLAGHLWYWYWPRQRPGTPDPSDLPARLFAAGPFDACFWIPFPHQNLGALAAAVGDWPGFLAAMARLGELPPPDLPSFGPFAVPPSREAVVCSDLEGGRLVVAARVYPALGFVARTAGRLAGNPWLAGGEIADPERPARVEWRDGLWTVAFAGAGLDDPGLIPEPLPAALAAIRLERRFSRFPVGAYLLRRDERGLELGLHGQPPPRRPSPDFGAEPRPALLAATESAELARSDAPTAVAIFATAPEPLAPLGLPGAAVFFERGGARWDLPGEGLFGLLQGALPKGNAGGWRIVALDGDSLRRAERLAPGLGKAVGAGSPDRLLLGLWVRPAEARELTARLRGRLEKVPLTGRRQVRRLRDWEIVLAPLARCDELSLVATEEPAAFRMRLDGC